MAKVKKQAGGRPARLGPRRIAAVFGPALRTESLVRIYSGIRQYAVRSGWHFEHVPFLSARLAEGAVFDGVIGMLSPDVIREATLRKIPVVETWYGPDGSRDVPRVMLDACESGRIVARHMLSRGFKRFGQMVRGAANPLAEIRRGFVDEIHRHDRALELSVCQLPLRMYQNSSLWRLGIAKMDEWIRSWQTPICVFCYDVSLLNVLAERCRNVHGLDIPRQVGLVCAGAQTMGEHYPMLKITGIRLNFEKVGIKAATLLDRLMKGRKPPTRPILVEPGEILMRESTDVTAVDDPVVAAAMHFMADHCHRKIQVRDIAAAAGVGRRTLECRFRETIGMTIAEELEYLRVEAAKRLLAESDEPAKAVAQQCGCASIRQLHRMFMRREHMAPTEYRRRLAAKQT